MKQLLIQIVHTCFNIYAKFRYFLYQQNFKKLHLHITFENFQLKTKILSHEDYITQTQVKIDHLINTKPLDECLKLILEEATGGCNFIIFSQKNPGKKFIQFWTGNGKLEFNFCANKKNNLKKYYYPVLGVLSEEGFATRKFRKKYFYVIDKYDDVLEIKTNFRKDFLSAAKVIKIILTEVYGLKPDNIKAEVN